jgi:hypothetical protein
MARVIGDVDPRGGRGAASGFDLGDQPVEPVGASGAEDNGRAE